jgi:hypothetical protein
MITGAAIPTTIPGSDPDDRSFPPTQIRFTAKHFQPVFQAVGGPGTSE